MTIVLANPNLIYAMIALMLAFASPNANAANFNASQHTAACTNIAQLADPQIRTAAAAACAGADLARVIVADKIRNTQFILAAEPTIDGRYNVVITAEYGPDMNIPQCDNGNNYRFFAQIEGPNTEGNRIEIKTRCLLKMLSAEAMYERVAQYAQSIGEDLDNAPWPRAMQLYEEVMRQIVNELMGR